MNIYDVIGKKIIAFSREYRDEDGFELRFLLEDGLTISVYGDFTPAAPGVYFSVESTEHTIVSYENK